MPEYNPKHPSPAYHIGAMVAVYAALQQKAYPDVNVTVVQRFFASAQQTPALVLGRQNVYPLPGKVGKQTVGAGI